MAEDTTDFKQVTTAFHTAWAVIQSMTTETSANFTSDSNDSDIYMYDIEEDKFSDDPFNFVYLMVCILGLIVNVMSVLAIVNIPHGLTTHSTLIISLNVSDSLILIAALCRNFLYIISDIQCISIIIRVLQDTGVMATLLNLLAMASDHYLAIMKPMSYRRFMTRLRCNFSILVIWTLSLTTGLLEVIVGGLTDPIDSYPFCLSLYIDDFDSELIVNVLIFVVLLCVVIFYTRIYIVARSFIVRDRTLYQDEMHNYKAIITTVLIISTFVIFWTPLAIFKFYTHFYIKTLQSNQNELKLANDFLYLFLLLNSLADPLIYAIRLQEVQRGYKVVFYKIFPSRRFSTNEEEFRHHNALNHSKRRDTTHTFVNDNIGCSSPDSVSDKLNEFDKLEESSFMPDSCCVQK